MRSILAFCVALACEIGLIVWAKGQDEATQVVVFVGIAVLIGLWVWSRQVRFEEQHLLERLEPLSLLLNASPTERSRGQWTERRRPPCRPSLIDCA